MISNQDVGYNLSGTNSKSKLLLIDFDLTITSEHIHNTLLKSNKKDPDKQWDLAKKILPRGNAKEWMFIIENAIANGYGIGILSFNDYDHIVKRYLKEIIFEGKTELLENKNIFIKCGATKGYDLKTSNKNAYIEEAKAYFNFNGNDKEIIFVDDSPKNIEAAKKAGYQTIFADKSDLKGSFISDLIEKVQTNEVTISSFPLTEDRKDPTAANTIDKNKDTNRTDENKDRALSRPVFRSPVDLMQGNHQIMGLSEKNVLIPAEENKSVGYRKKITPMLPVSFQRPTTNTASTASTIASSPSTTVTINILKSTMEVVCQMNWVISADNIFIDSRPLSSEIINKNRLKIIDFFKTLGIDVTDVINKGKAIDILKVDGTEDPLYFRFLDLASALKIRVNVSWFKDVIGIHQIKTIIDIFTKTKCIGLYEKERTKLIDQLKEIYDYAYKKLKRDCRILAQAGRTSNGGINSKDGDGIATLPHDLLIHIAYFTSVNLFSKNKKEVEAVYNHYLEHKTNDYKI